MLNRILDKSYIFFFLSKHWSYVYVVYISCTLYSTDGTNISFFMQEGYDY